jgi:hypothetical protein
VSLIFSALSEMEKQAKEGQPSHAPMASAQSYSPERKQWPILVGTLVALGLVAFIAVKLLSPDNNEETAAPQNAAAVASPPAINNTSSAAALPSANLSAPAKAEIAPYMQTALLESAAEPLVSNTGTTSIVNQAPVATNVLPAALAFAATPASPTPETNPPASSTDVQANVDSSTVASATLVPVPEPAPVQAAPAPRVQPDKSYLDKTTFKLGRQPDNSKDQDVSHWVNVFSNEMSAGNYEQARSHLSKLQSKLPAQSITLLRMQAWYSVDTSDDATAREYFLRILDRVPDDQNAGVNVALIDWRAKRTSAALARIDRLHQLYPDSTLVSQNWRSMHDQRQ